MRRKTPADYGPPIYKVGKGRPPVRSRWKRGQSGNPKGRPKGSKSLDTILTQVMNGKIKYTKNGKERTITVREAILKKMGNDALKGDFKAALYLLARDAEIAKKNPSVYSRSAEPTDPKERERWAMESYLKLVKG